MRILQVSYAYPPFFASSGPPIKVQSICRGLARLGHDVTVVSVDHSRPSRGFERRDDSVDVVYLRSLMRYSLTVTVNPGILSYCISRLRQFEVVHLYGLYDLLGPVVARFCVRWKIPYLLEPLGMHRPMTRSLMKKRIYRNLAGNQLLQGAAHIVASSEAERTRLVQDGVPAEKILVRRNGVDLPNFEGAADAFFRPKWKIHEKQPLILFLGRLTATKNPDLLLKAFASSENTSAHLAFAGPDDDLTAGSLYRTAEKHGVANRVTFTGPLKGQEKTAALREADLLVLPSKSESFGNAAAEALACGTPVIVGQDCGIAPYVQDRAGLVVPASADDLRMAMDQLLSDQVLRSRFAGAAPGVAAELSWDEPLDQMESLYREMAGSQTESGN